MKNNDNEKELNLIKEKQFCNSNNQLTVVTTSGYKLAKVRLDKNFFENLLVLEMDLEDNFSLEKLFELIKQYSIAIEYYLQHDHRKAKAYQNRMEYLLTNKDTLIQLKRQNDKKNNINNDNNDNENNNKNNNEKNINNNKIKSALNIQKEYVKIRKDDINLEDISKKVTKVLNSSNKKSENNISWKNIINNDLEKQNSNWKEKLKSKKKNASRFSVKPSLGGIRKRFMGSANDANMNSASNDNNNVDNNPKVSDFKSPFEELYGENENENDKNNNNIDIIEEDVEDKKEEIKENENKENKINDPIKNIIIEEKIKEEEKAIDEDKKEISQENNNKIENKEEEKDNKEENQNIEVNKIEEKKDENMINENNSEENSKGQKQNEVKEIREEDKNENKVDDKSEIKEEITEIKEEKIEIKEDKNEIKEEKMEIKEEDKNEIKEEKNEIKEEKIEIKEDKSEIKEDKNEIKEVKNEIKEEKKDQSQNQNNTEITEIPNTKSPFEDPLFTKKSILEDDIIGNIKPDEEISSPIESLLTSLKNKIIQINAQNTQNEGNNEEEEESEFSSSNTDLTKVKSSNNDLDKIPGKFQGAYLDIQTIMDNYIYDFNQFFYKEIFEQFSSDLKELYEQKYKKYIEIRNEYHAQIKENEYLLELDENLTKEKKEEIQQTIESLNEEQQHQIDVVEDEFNKKISDKISEFKQNTFKHNSGIQLLEEKVKLDIYSLINDAFIN